MRPINLVVIHCSDSPNDNDRVDAATIHKWHVEQGWSGIGYHYVIDRDGTVENGRPDYWIGAHVKGHNATSIGICLVGRDEFTEPQWASLWELTAKLVQLYGDVRFAGHRELDPNKTCPNFDVKPKLRELFDRFGGSVSGVGPWQGST